MLNASIPKMNDKDDDENEETTTTRTDYDLGDVKNFAALVTGNVK